MKIPYVCAVAGCPRFRFLVPGSWGCLFFELSFWLSAVNFPFSAFPVTPSLQKSSQYHTILLIH
jgi:hypothetical protein